MAHKIRLADLDSTMTVAQLIHAYAPLGFEAHLLLTNVVADEPPLPQVPLEPAIVVKPDPDISERAAEAILDLAIQDAELRGIEIPAGSHEDEEEEQRVVAEADDAAHQPEPERKKSGPTKPGKKTGVKIGEEVGDPFECAREGCTNMLRNKHGGRPRKYCGDKCRRDANPKRAPKTKPTTPVVEPISADYVAPPLVCGRCDQPGHSVIDCRFTSQAQARRALRGTTTSDGGTLVKGAEGGPLVKLDPPKKIDPRPEPERPKEQQRVQVPAVIDITDDEVLGKQAMALREQWAEGYPGGYSFLPDVLALYGVTEEIVESALRAPERVEVRPESFEKNKRYTVLGFFKGDVSVILGLRDVHKPCVIAVYVGSMLEADTHRVGHTGGGGSKKEAGIPTTPVKVARRLRSMGAEVEVDERDEEPAKVTYQGQELGFISTGSKATRLVCQADFQRMQRKMHAIDRRESVSA